MIELLQNLPKQVVGFSASGQVTADDYERFVIPAIELALKQHGKVRVLYHLGPAFSGFTAGAMWDDAKLGITHLKAWEKIAVVTDIEWVIGAIRVFRFAIPGQFKLFSNNQLDEATRWVSA